MVEVQIEALKSELNHLIDKGSNFNDIYELSVKLDKLIVQYYVEKNSLRHLL